MRLLLLVYEILKQGAQCKYQKN